MGGGGQAWGRHGAGDWWQPEADMTQDRANKAFKLISTAVFLKRSKKEMKTLMGGGIFPWEH